MIQLQVVSVSHHNSSKEQTVTITYNASKTPTENAKAGAEWEDVVFAQVYKETPRIRVSNYVGGDSLLTSGTLTVIIQYPDLFGSYKVGDIIQFGH